MVREKSSRYTRKPDAVGKIRPQPRDVEIIRLVWEYRFLNSEQIRRLVGGSDQVILRRLQKLYHHGHLDRPISQIVFSNALLGHQKMVYGLGDEGADLLADRCGIDRGRINWKEKNKGVGERYIQHTLMVSQFRACLTLALADNNQARLLSWTREDPQLFRQNVYYTEGRKRRRARIVPDGYFQIEDAGGKMDFFLEADRSTMTNARFLNKMRAYWHWWRQKGQRKLGIGDFRVLTITRTDKRMENLIGVTKRAGSRNSGYMFWFTTEKHVDLENPSEILQAVWRTATPGDQSLHSILE